MLDGVNVVLALLATFAGSGCPSESETAARSAAAAAVLDRCQPVIEVLDQGLQALGVDRPPPAFSLTRNPIVPSAAQMAEFARRGRYRVFEFGWPVIEREVLAEERAALDALDTLAAAQGGELSCRAMLVETRDRLRQDLDRTRFYVDRTRSWDGFCRGGPWLTEPGTRVELETEIDRLERGGGDPARLRDLRTVHGHYYRMKPNPRAVALLRTAGGYCLTVRISLWGAGADEAVRERIERAVESFWRGEVDGLAFVTRAEVRIAPPGEPDRWPIEVAGPGEVFMPSTTRFHHGVEPETAAHEVGHVLGFADRYRDLFDPRSGVYVCYMEDVQSLMAAQNLAAPVVTEVDLADLVWAYLAAGFER